MIVLWSGRQKNHRKQVSCWWVDPTVGLPGLSPRGLVGCTRALNTLWGSETGMTALIDFETCFGTLKHALDVCAKLEVDFIIGRDFPCSGSCGRERISQIKLMAIPGKHPLQYHCLKVKGQWSHRWKFLSLTVWPCVSRDATMPGEESGE